jgi:hypothetical protein
MSADITDSLFILFSFTLFSSFFVFSFMYLFFFPALAQLRDSS